MTNPNSAPPRIQLAVDVAAALDGLNLNNTEARTVLAERLLAHGITHTMHAERLDNKPSPLRETRAGMSTTELGNMILHNLSALEAQIRGVETWPPVEQIEYKLGQIFAILQRPIPGLSETTLDRCRADLLRLAAGAR